MRLCQIVPSLEERHGGPSKSVTELAMALAGLGPEVDLLATTSASPEDRRIGPLRIQTFARGWPAALCPSAGLRRRLQEGPADVVHHHSLWLRTLHYAHRAASRSGARLVVSPRGMMAAWAWNHHRWKKAGAAACVHPGALRAAHGWHATSSEEADAIRARGFAQPVCLAPNGVTGLSPAAARAAAAHWTAACPAVAERPVALFYSRFHRKKRLLELLDAWLDHAPRDWLLLVVGIPEEYSVALLEERVRRAGGAERVRVFSGLDRPPPYPVARLFLLPSHDENFGLAIGEALAAGVPALVTDTTPWAALSSLGGGWCVPWPEYPAALRRATAEPPETLRRRGETARDWVRAEFCWEKSARTLLEFYAHLGAA